MRPIDVYRSIFENAVEGIFQSTPDGYYLNVNPALAAIYGYESPEELMESVKDIQNQLYVNPERRKDFQTAMDESGIVHHFESEIYRKDGSTTWISENVRAVKEDGIIVYYEGFVMDISDQKKIEKEHVGMFSRLKRAVKNRTREIRRSRNALLSFINNMSDAVTIIDPDGKILAINKEAAKEYGIPSSEMIDKCLYDFMPIQYAMKLRLCHENVVSSGIPLRELYEFNGLNKEVKVMPLYTESEKPTYIVIQTRRDIVIRGEAV